MDMNSDTIYSQRFLSNLSNKIYTINLSIHNGLSVARNLTLRIEEENPNLALGYPPTGYPIFSREYIVPADLDGEYMFDLDAVHIEKDQRYHVVLVSKTSNIQVYSCNTDLYGDGYYLKGDLQGTGSNYSVRISDITNNDSMDKANLRHVIEVLKNQSNDSLGIELDIEYSGLKVCQQDPWNILLFANVSLITRKPGLSFTHNANITTSISIEGIQDPLFSYINLERSIRRSLVVNWTAEKVLGHLKNATYVYNENAPSFLMRFENQTWNTSTCCGIESLINQADDVNMSFVDYQFWSGRDNCENGSDLWTAQGITDQGIPFSTFRLDTAHLNFYNLTNLTKECNASVT